MSMIFHLISIFIFYLAESEANMDNMKSIGNRILERRKELRLTQTDIFNKCGLSTGALSKIENGIRVPSCTIFYDLACALNCSMDWLMTGTSANEHNVELCQKEEKLLNGFRELSEVDKEELIEILDMKLRKLQRTRGTSAKSFRLTDTEKDSMVG